ncbi:MAG: protein kinase [Phycisphaerales bacterium]|nr:protein kinase [Phycisphaerales bacterium]
MAVESPIREKPGTRIGPYKLLQVIGEGGFGVVFMAEQETPVRRRVALKIIKLGMDTRQVIARFEAERQALALMDHPHIARVFDGGATNSPSPSKSEGGEEGKLSPSPFKGEGRGEGSGGSLPAGRPYFVMEYVKGDPITQFADARKLSIRERLELFGQVCSAVQHAHTKGIIHRDIKPRNVLTSMVDGKPFARVIDFGIAKATGSPLTDKTLFTEHRQLIGTPEYMSPEQAEGSPDIDTRADVYALGVLLYELLTGATPFDAKRLRSAAFAEMQRIIRDEEPLAPSVRVTRLRADAPLSEPRPLGSGLSTEPRPSGSGLPSDPRPDLSEPRPLDSGSEIHDPSAKQPLPDGRGSEMQPLPHGRGSEKQPLPSGSRPGHAPFSVAFTPQGRGSDSAATIAHHRRTDAATLLRTLRGELDWIVMKALDKDRARRYETPNQLADDVRRHLSGEPIIAAPPNAVYRLRKFVRKHKTGVVAASAVAAALLLGIAGTTWQWRAAIYYSNQLQDNARVMAAALSDTLDAANGAATIEGDSLLPNSEFTRFSKEQFKDEGITMGRRSDGQREFWVGQFEWRDNRDPNFSRTMIVYLGRQALTAIHESRERAKALEAVNTQLRVQNDLAISTLIDLRLHNRTVYSLSLVV